jgi:hypothetical protein
MPSRAVLSTIRLIIVLITSLLLVHATTGVGLAGSPKSKTTSNPPASAKTKSAGNQLPAAVEEMRDGILAAVKSGRIEDLQVPIAWNELPPAFAKEATPNPIDYFKKQSGDGEGREILAIMASVLAAGFATVPTGKDVENNRLFVWPRFAELPLDKLSPEDEVELYRLVTPAMVKLMREQKKWTWYRLVIGADGTWHSFSKTD